MVSLSKLLGLVLTAASAVSGYSNPGACSGHCWAHDPSVIQRASDGLYFKFNTGSGIEIATSSSLEGPWTLQGYVLPSGSSIDLDGNTDLWVCPTSRLATFHTNTSFRHQMFTSSAAHTISTMLCLPSVPRAAPLDLQPVARLNQARGRTWERQALHRHPQSHIMQLIQT
jgi:hypothetical protein